MDKSKQNMVTGCAIVAAVVLIVVVLLAVIVARELGPKDTGGEGCPDNIIGDPGYRNEEGECQWD